MSESAQQDGDGTEPAPESSGPRDVVYTALFGQYESLNEEPFAVDSATGFICFTDDPSLTSDTWQVELVEPMLPMDPVRSARWVKIFGDELIWRDAGRSLWVDNRVTLKCEPRKILDSVLEEPNCDIAMFEHSFRARVIDEFDAVAQSGYDDPGRVYEQLLHYAESSPDVLDERPLWTGFMARRHNDRVASAMQTWAAHVCRYSRRDQLSVNFALNEPKLLVRRLEGENRESDWHVWPPISAELNRQGMTRSRAFQHAVRAPLVRLRALERDQNVNRPGFRGGSITWIRPR